MFCDSFGNILLTLMAEQFAEAFFFKGNALSGCRIYENIPAGFSDC